MITVALTNSLHRWDLATVNMAWGAQWQVLPTKPHLNVTSGHITTLNRAKQRCPGWTLLTIMSVEWCAGWASRQVWLKWQHVAKHVVEIPQKPSWHLWHKTEAILLKWSLLAKVTISKEELSVIRKVILRCMLTFRFCASVCCVFRYC